MPEKTESKATTAPANASSLAKTWHFESPKNEQRLVIKGEPMFMMSILAEGMTHLASYDPTPVTVESETKGKDVNVTFTMSAKTIAGDDVWLDFVRPKLGRPDNEEAERTAAIQNLLKQQRGQYYSFDEDKLRSMQKAFDNWLVICAAITRCRFQHYHHEKEHLYEVLTDHTEAKLGALLSAEGMDRAGMFAVIGKGLQQGIIEAELNKALLTHNSVLRKVPHGQFD